MKLHAETPWRVVLPILAADLVLFFTPLLALGYSPSEYTRDSSPTAVLSAAHLLAIAWLCFGTYRLRRRAEGLATWRASYLIWAVMTVGFAYLAIDEVARIHENLDRIIHRAFHLERNPFTERLDDLIIGGYGLVGVLACVAYRKEFLRYRRLVPWLALGFVLVFTMVAVDVANHRNDLLPRLLEDGPLRMQVHRALILGEELFKILAEGIFLGVFFLARQLAKGDGQLSDGQPGDKHPEE